MIKLDLMMQLNIHALQEILKHNLHKENTQLSVKEASTFLVAKKLELVLPEQFIQTLTLFY